MTNQATSTTGYLDATQVRQFEQDGYLMLRNIIPLQEIDAMRAMFSLVTDEHIRELKQEGLITDERKDLPLERRFAKVAGQHAGRFGRSWRKTLGRRATFDLHHSADLVNCIAQLLGTNVIGHPVFNGRPKMPSQQ